MRDKMGENPAMLPTSSRLMGITVSPISVRDTVGEDSVVLPTSSGLMESTVFSSRGRDDIGQRTGILSDLHGPSAATCLAHSDSKLRVGARTIDIHYDPQPHVQGRLPLQGIDHYYRAKFGTFAKDVANTTADLYHRRRNLLLNS
jgi:hypothetical protein